jgi:DNA-binding NarL/FixJ family response regulator
MRRRYSMNKMTAGQFLGKALSINHLINSTQEAIESMTPPHCQLSGCNAPAPGNAEPDRQIKRHELILRLEDYKDKLNEYNEVLFQIIVASDITAREKILLQQRYMIGKSWKEVAKVLDVELETVYVMDRRLKRKLNMDKRYWEAL